MSDNGDRPARGLDGIVAELRLMLADVEAETVAAREVLAAKEAERKRIETMIRDATVEKPGRKSAQDKVRMSEGKLAEFRDEIREIVASGESADPETPGSFSSMMLQKKTGLVSSRVDLALRLLREDGTIRLVGERKDPTSKGRARRIYRLADSTVKSGR